MQILHIYPYVPRFDITGDNFQSIFAYNTHILHFNSNNIQPLHIFSDMKSKVLKFTITLSAVIIISVVIDTITIRQAFSQTAATTTNKRVVILMLVQVMRKRY
jgi:hypothetical protein